MLNENGIGMQAGITRKKRLSGESKGESVPGYILLIAVILVMAMAGTAYLGLGPAGLSGSDRTESDIYWRAARPLAITEARYLANSTVLLVVKNKDFAPVELVHFSLAGSEQYFADPIALEPGESTEFAIHSPPTISQNSLCEYDGVAFYLSRGGPEFPQRGTRPLIIPCRQEQAAVCSADGASCQSPSACCSGICSPQGQKCAQCLEKGDFCSADSQCCQSPLAQACKSGRCEICISEGEGDCQVGAGDCCGALKCSSLTQKCLSCLPAGNLCSVDAECCGGFACVSGRCRSAPQPQ